MLVQVQHLDTRLDQLAHQRAGLPEAARLAELTTRAAALDRAVALAETTLSDIQREADKAEADVQLVRDRAARDRRRLDAGTGTAKDLQALQHELVSLARRQSDLEDIQLEVMERAEQAETELTRLRDERTELAGTLAEVAQARDAAYLAIDAQHDEVTGRRATLAPQVGAELLALYDKVRAQAGGVGAAELRQRRCGGCQLELNQVDLSRIRSAAPDEVLRCEECRRILVRTDQSGL